MAVPDRPRPPAASLPDAGPPASRRELLDVSVRFVNGFGRWLEQRSTDGLTYARVAVLEILHCQGPKRMKDLAGALGLSARHLTAVADALEADGLVGRLPHPTDRRATLLELTDTGRAAADCSLAPRMAKMAALFNELPAPAQAELAKSLGILVEAMDRTGGCDSAPCDVAATDLAG